MKTHKAQYSPEIVAVIRRILLERFPEYFGRPKIWDPFAGPGLRLAEICGEDFDYGGTEIEESFIINQRIIHGTATDPGLYPHCPFLICTSPVYANGVADHAAMNDNSTRNNYRKWVGIIEGADRELAEENMGRYGYRGTKRGGSSQKRVAYWDIAERSIKNWSNAEMVILNVSDFLSGTVVEPHVADWVGAMYRHGWCVTESERVETRRLKLGENHDVRVPFEVVLVFEHI